MVAASKSCSSRPGLLIRARRAASLTNCLGRLRLARPLSRFPFFCPGGFIPISSFFCGLKAKNFSTFPQGKLTARHVRVPGLYLAAPFLPFLSLLPSCIISNLAGLNVWMESESPAVHQFSRPRSETIRPQMHPGCGSAFRMTKLSQFSPAPRFFCLFSFAVLSLFAGCGKMRSWYANAQTRPGNPHSVTIGWTASKSIVAGTTCTARPPRETQSKFPGGSLLRPVTPTERLSPARRICTTLNPLISEG